VGQGFIGLRQYDSGIGIVYVQGIDSQMAKK